MAQPDPGPRIARLLLQDQAIIESLGLPDGTKIVAVEQANDLAGVHVALIVEHPGLRAVPYGDSIPLVAPVVHIDAREPKPGELIEDVTLKWERDDGENS